MRRFAQVRPETRAALVDFSQEFPWGSKYPPSLVHRFLYELVSSESMILDLFEGGERVATAVLLDLVNNPSQDACLEIIGMREPVDQNLVVDEIMSEAIKRCPGSRAGIQIGISEKEEKLHSLLEAKGFHRHYSTFEMMNRDFASQPIERQSQIFVAGQYDGEKVYNLLCKSFAKNLEASIPEKDIFLKSFMKYPGWHYFLWKQETKLVAFAQLCEPESGVQSEIRTIGVLPEYRGLGIGRDLLRHCLNESNRLGFGICELTVAVENEKALSLYLRAGFSVVEKHLCYRLQLR